MICQGGLIDPAEVLKISWELFFIVLMFFSSLLFAALFWLISFQYPADPGSIDSYRIVEIFQQYAAFAGIVLGFLSLLLMAGLSGIFSLLGMGESRFKKPVVIILGFSPWAAFGYQLVYREPRYANIAKAIIEYLGEPMLYAGLALVGLGLLWLVISVFRKPPLHPEKS